jgi:hypothetical protein
LLLDQSSFEDPDEELDDEFDEEFEEELDDEFEDEFDEELEDEFDDPPLPSSLDPPFPPLPSRRSRSDSRLRKLKSTRSTSLVLRSVTVGAGNAIPACAAMGKSAANMAVVMVLNAVMAVSPVRGHLAVPYKDNAAPPGLFPAFCPLTDP